MRWTTQLLRCPLPQCLKITSDLHTSRLTQGMVVPPALPCTLHSMATDNMPEGSCGHIPMAVQIHTQWCKQDTHMSLRTYKQTNKPWRLPAVVFTRHTRRLFLARDINTHRSTHSMATIHTYIPDVYLRAAETATGVVLTDLRSRAAGRQNSAIAAQGRTRRTCWASVTNPSALRRSAATCCTPEVLHTLNYITHRAA